MSKDEFSLAHTLWNCKYHIVFAPKYRRQVFFGEKRIEIGKILRKLCEFKQVHIVEAEVCPDNIHGNVAQQMNKIIKNFQPQPIKRLSY